MKESSGGGYALLRSIMNMSFLWGITSSYMASRQCSPIRKSGGMVISKIKCLRPVSQATELAAVQDGLLLARHGLKLVRFWGADQYGGTYEAQAPVLGTFLLAQLRKAAGLPTFLNFTDQIHAFDIAHKDDIRLGLFRAGVRGKSWLVFDDQLAQDHVRLSLFFLGVL